MERPLDMVLMAARIISIPAFVFENSAGSVEVIDEQAVLLQIDQRVENVTYELIDQNRASKAFLLVLGFDRCRPRDMHLHAGHPYTNDSMPTTQRKVHERSSSNHGRPLRTWRETALGSMRRYRELADRPEQFRERGAASLAKGTDASDDSNDRKDCQGDGRGDRGAQQRGPDGVIHDDMHSTAPEVLRH